MANIIRIKRRVAAGGTGAPATLENAELAFNEFDSILYYGVGTGGAGGSATTIVPIGGGGMTLTGDVGGTIGANAIGGHKVTFAKMQEITTARFLGRVTAATGDVEELTAANAKTILALAHTDLSDFDAGVQANRLDQMAVPTASVSMNSQKITNLLNPTSAQDAASKDYVDNLVAGGLDVKSSCRAATTASITLSAPQTIDGVSVIAGDRVLVKDQGTAANGIYVVAAGAWTRATDADTSAEVTSGLFTFITEGTANASSGWVLTTADPINLGTTVLVFAQYSGAGQITAGTGMTKTGNTLDVIGTANRIVANADSIDIHSSYAGQTSITTLGTVGTGSWHATTIDADHGGTGQTVYVVGDVLQASTTTALSRLAAVATGNVLISGGAGVVSSWGKVGLTTHISGTLPVANGGTNITSYAIGDLLQASTSGVLSVLTAVATGNVLISGGIGVVSSWGKVALTTHVSGTLPVANGGTGVTASTGSVAVVLSTSPTLVTPVLGVASATSINKVAITAPATSATLTIANGKTLTANSILTLAGTDSKTLTVNNSLTLSGTDGTTMTFPAASATVAGLGTTQTFTGINTFTPAVRTSGVGSYFTITTPADTGLTLSTEVIGANFTAATRQWAAGALTLQRERVFAAPTFAFVGASTLTTAINADFADPIAGTNATLTNSYSIRAANVLITGLLKVGTGPTTLTDSAGKILSAALNTVAVANGGTGLTAGTSGGILYYSATGTLASTALLTSNRLVLGAGAGAAPDDTAGLATDGTSILYLGVAGGAVGKTTFYNATSGSITLAPVTGALGTITLSLPALSGTLLSDASTIDGGTF